MRKFLLAFLCGLLLAAGLTQVTLAQTLSAQVLQLLTRQNTFTATNTFLDLRLIKGVPSVTTLRFYVDNSGSLYFNGNAVTAPGGATLPHNLLSTTHTDTLAAAAVRGSVLVANATPAWAAVGLCPSGNYLGSNGTDTVCATSAASFTAIPAAQITGTASAFDGNAITNLNATQLLTGTVPLARLANIVNAQISASAAIAYSKLALTGAILNADLAGSIAYSKLVLTGSVVTGDLTANTLLFNTWAANGCTNLQVPQYNGSAWVCKSLLTSDITSGGTVTSVGLSAPAILTVGSSPVTTSGTISLTLATQTANTIWAGPTTGAAAQPTFRAMVNADLPLTGVGAGTYTKVTLNTAGVATAASAQITLTTDVTGTLPMANGGTGVAVSADDTVLVGSGTAWVAQTLPNCTTGALNYTVATNLWSCNTSAPTHSILSATHSDSLAAVVVRGDLIVGNTTPAWSRLAKGAAGTLLGMGAAGTDPAWINAVSGLTATTAASGTLGSVALPFSSVILGTAATNTLTVSPAAFAAGSVATVSDPGIATAILPLVKRGTIAYTAGALTTGTCSAAQTATVTGLATTSVVNASHNAAPGAQWQTGIYFLAYPTANTVNIIVCNPTAGTITPNSATFNYEAVIP